MVALPVQVTFRNTEHSDFIEAEVRKKAAELDRFSDRIMSCRVVVEAPHRRHQKGKLYAVRIDITLPGKEIVVTHSGPLDHAHEDAHVAIRDAFLAAGEASLKSRASDGRDVEIGRLKEKVGELTMTRELLETKIDRLEQGHPLARRRRKR